MLIAMVDNKPQIARRTGSNGVCPECSERVTSRVGAITRPHWAHLPTTRSRCSRRDAVVTPWQESWQFKAHDLGCDIEVSMTGEGGQVRWADIVTPNGLVIELQSTMRIPAESASRERFYDRRAPLGMIWLLRQPDSVTLRHYGVFHGRRSPRLALLDARSYWAGDPDRDPVHSVTFATKRFADSGRVAAVARCQNTWTEPEGFLAWAMEWNADHLEQPGGWVRGVWHSDDRQRESA